MLQKVVTSVFIRAYVNVNEKVDHVGSIDGKYSPIEINDICFCFFVELDYCQVNYNSKQKVEIPLF